MYTGRPSHRTLAMMNALGMVIPGDGIPRRYRMSYDTATPQPKSPQDLERIAAAEAKRKRRGEKLANTRSLGGIQGLHATQVIVDELA